MKIATRNLVSEDGEYEILVWKGQLDDHGYWNNYTYGGHAMRMDNPKRGEVVQMPYGDLFKIERLGTINIQTVELGQEHAVFLKEYPG